MAHPATPDDGEPTLEEQLEHLTRLREAPHHEFDPAEVTAALGEVYLALYERDRKPELLDHATAEYEQALRTAPGHPDRAGWWYWLGTARAELAEQRDQVPLFDEAIGALNEAMRVLPPADPDRFLMNVDVADAWWRRFWTCRYRRECDSARALAEADRLVRAVEALATGADQDRAPAEVVAHLRLFVGLARLARHDETGQRPDLEAGIDTLAPTLAVLGHQAQYATYAAAELCFAYLDRAGQDENPADVDLAIELGERARGWEGAAAAELAWQWLHTALALCYHTRWDLVARPADLDRAVECWQEIPEPELRPQDAGSYGSLARQRAEHTGAAADLATAVRLLEHAAAAALPQDSDVWLELVRAYRSGWTLHRQPGRLTDALAGLDRLLPPELPAEAALAVHAERVQLAHDILEYEDTTAGGGSPAGIERLDSWLADARVFVNSADLPADQRGILATLVAYGEIYLGAFAFDQVDLDRIARLLALGRQVTGCPEGWLAIVDYAEGVVEQARQARQPTRGGDGGMAQLLRAAAARGLDRDLSETIMRTVPMAGFAASVRRGHQRGTGAAASSLTGAPGEDPADPVAAGAAVQAREAFAVQAALQAVTQARPGDLTALAAELVPLRTILDSDPETPIARTFRPVVAAVDDILAGRLDGEEPEPAAPPSGPMASFEALGQIFALAGPLLRAEARKDAEATRRCAERIDALAAPYPDGHLVRAAATALRAQADGIVSRLEPHDVVAARRAARTYADAQRQAGPQYHPLWHQFAMGEAAALRMALRAAPPATDHLDRRRSRELGVSALRGHGWQVLSQSGTDHAVAAARQAATDALTVAGWCLDDLAADTDADDAAGYTTARDDLITALDGGRGLVLHAATASAQFPDLLTAAGHPDLAAEWRATAGLGRDLATGDPLAPASRTGEIPDDLRARALDALAAETIGPMATVTASEIQAALGTLGADALVYLVPGRGDRAGTAVVVPAAGEVDPVMLPKLVTGPGTPVSRHIRAVAGARDAEPAIPAPPRTATVEELCRWAWSAAMEQLVAYTRRWCLPRPARLVLVPMGMLGLVPWHAAVTGAGTATRHALTELVVSYTVSARMLCATAQRQPRPVGSALVVGDPDGSLPAAGMEARALWQRFYPQGTYLGSRHPAGAGPGTPKEVLDWLAAAAGSSMLHFACHGTMDPERPADARLSLAGGELAARDLLETSRLAALDIQQVFLAACTTHLSGDDHDEVFSLAASFLAAGAHTVVGSLWKVPDTETSLLMYLVHHFLREEGDQPADALHRAQRWMLDPARRPPAGMPPELARHCHRPELADPHCWAAFTHLGR